MQLRLLGLNDFHGHLKADDPPLSRRQDPSQTPVGGVEYLATTLQQLRASAPGSTLTVAAGDLIGGSTFISGLFQDEPAVEALDALKLDVSSVGNHEFDEGTTELLRMQYGGCHPVAGCFLPGVTYPGARFRWLSANVVQKRDGMTLLPAYEVRDVQGVKVGFIGMTLEATNTLVSPAGVSTVDFLDEVETANLYARALVRQGVKSIIVLLHEGGLQTGAYNECAGISGPVADIAARLDPEIDALITGHTHEPYICSIPGPDGQPRPVTSAASYGRVVTELNLVLNRSSGNVIPERTTAFNHLVTRTVAKDPVQTAIITKWNAMAAPRAARVLGRISADITGDASGNRGIETPMADVVADSILFGTEGAKGGAQLALTNVGGVRASLRAGTITNGEQPGEVTYEEAYLVLPFGNLLVSLDLTGDQIRQILEEQYQPVPARGARPMLALGVSHGFTYEWDATRPQGSRVVPGSMKLHGVPLDLAATYRVGTLNFLADGGDLFTTFTQGQNRLGGPEDLENLAAYLGAVGLLSPPPDRVTGL
ncbi:bifunctional metallophosphatase/5'-nucleotidase [Pyxidicoccus xibeiensis]|uniref:bifunctional metallophosphatase/5'-nucleotidase n=1 Tax=Pyxidicoccus xibeiensis TaxID=2906759 RepID=UPI0020A710B2|nr:5'-nucleotidase C-terminal domain-containing protein [Pyxidicoccus xibeiensis]MCP3138288.1 bifunctional metallophosphatase/5'-nucleotidase [Pyxidicoccus xibeiensis]